MYHRIITHHNPCNTGMINVANVDPTGIASNGGGYTGVDNIGGPDDDNAYETIQQSDNKKLATYKAKNKEPVMTNSTFIALKLTQQNDSYKPN
ncbi:hypothetical protein M8J76_015334 [Diaphorina citri]|nr:hypothetical protein M8J76_015334 [Diaphorina citri]